MAAAYERALIEKGAAVEIRAVQAANSKAKAETIELEIKHKGGLKSHWAHHVPEKLKGLATFSA